MRLRVPIVIVIVLVAGLARADLVVERWGGKGVDCAHPDALRVEADGQATRLIFDLSGLPKDAKVLHASLYCQTRDDLQPIQPPQVLAGIGANPLPLEPPMYASFDATAAVAAWAKDPKGNDGFAVTLDGLLAARSSLEIRYEARPPPERKLPDQVSGLRAVHHDGQTFLVFREIPLFVPAPEKVRYVTRFTRRRPQTATAPAQGWLDLPAVPCLDFATLRDLQGYLLRDKPSGFQGIRPLQRSRKMPEVQYRVYRHGERITPANIAQAELAGLARPLAAWDERMGVITFKGEYIDQQEVADSIIPVACVEDGKPLAAGENWFAVSVEKEGKRYYAVTTVVDGTENVSGITDANSLAAPIQERPGTPAPVLQRVGELPLERAGSFQERFYWFFAAPPFTNLPVNRPLYVIVGVPPKLEAVSPAIIDFFHSDYSLFEALRAPSATDITLLIEHMIAWGGDGDLGFNEGMGTLRPYSQCFVRDFSERYAVASIEWARRTWKMDPSRIFGGQHDSGPLHFGIRHPEIFARIFLGRYTASYDLKWAPGSGGLTRLLGPRGLAKTPDGQDAWLQLDVGWYVNQNPGKDIPFMTLFSTVGKDTGHTSEFGWQDDPRGWSGLLRARQPVLASWSVQTANSQGTARWVHEIQPEIAAALPRMKLESAMPAFSNCSLDNNPGNGDPADGDFVGQINGYLLWDDGDCADQPHRWEMTVWVVKGCPDDRCTVDVTPRHCKAFKPKPAERFKWTNTSIAENNTIDSGDVAADKFGLVTLPQVTVTKGRNRLAIERIK